MREDVAAQLTRYRGFLEWDTPSPGVSIELFIKESSIPIRKPKMTEISTVPSIDPLSGFDTRSQALFFGAPDILQVTLSGWMITPISGNSWAPVNSSGGALGSTYGDITYPELVCAYIEGRVLATSTQAVIRKDPDRYITPLGQQYNSPVIATFDWNFTVNRRKQQFNMTLWLEK